MGIFAKTVDAYNYQDVAELIGASESVMLEFKSKVDNDDDLLKELVAFANTFGGYLIIGAEEKDSRLQALPGVQPVDGFQQRIIDLCLTRIVPPIVPYPSPPITVPGSRQALYVIHSPASLSGPHFLVGRKGAYVRVSEHDKPYEPRLAQWEELAQLARRREQTLALRSSLRERASLRAQTKMPGDAVLAEIFISPAHPSRPLVEIARLGSLVEGARVQARGVSYPRGDAEPLHESVAYTPHPERPQDYYTEATIYGTAFVATDLRRRVEGQEKVPILAFMANLLLWPVFGRKYLRVIGYQGPVFVSAMLRRIRNREFIWREEMWFEPHSHAPRFDDDVSAELETSARALADDIKSVTLDLFLPLAYACGFDSLLRENRDNLVGRAVEYLGWSLDDVVANR